MLSGSEIRTLFLRYFQEKGHLVLPSASLVPANDPTLLLTSAGMVQMKPFFLGEAVPPSPRLATCQKVFRTTDIENVGNERSLTFFEMLGNFSVGDYFKAGAISFAWEFLTQRVGFAPENLWPSVYPDDDEAVKLWIELTGIPPERIVRLEENWWEAGPVGPNGPDSEIYVDRGVELGCGKDTCAPGCDCPRFLEVWNLVFMQYYTDAAGVRTPLPRKNIDTGMGLERLTLLLQKKPTVYETDLFWPIIERASRISGATYGSDDRTTRALRVIADHSRAVAFLIGDAVLPSNEGRGYVLRRLLRRAVRFGRVLGIQRPFLTELVAVAIGMFGDAYPDLEQRRDFILKVVEIEEARFSQTLTVGLNLLEELIATARGSGQNQIGGEDAFRLHDTYGFPIELTTELAGEAGLAVDLASAERAMARQREAARAAARFGQGRRQASDAYAQLPLDVTFLGYERLDATSQIVAIVLGDQVVGQLSEGDEGEIILRETPFYAESGGQVGDTGTISNERGVAEVLDTQKPTPSLIVHRVRLTRGSLLSGDVVEAQVAAWRRGDIARNHTATHLLHKALRETLGTHVQQAGSLVAPDRLRFDFTHFKPVSADELAAIEARVNEEIRENLPKETTITTYQEALAAGAMALFGEKYGDNVRMVCLGDYSCELCGGTHVARTGDIGYFLISSEGSVGSNVRRIEALTGRGADSAVRQKLATLDRLSQRLGADVENRVVGLVEELQEERRRVQQLQRQLAAADVDRLIANKTRVDSVWVVSAQVAASGPEALRDLGDLIKSKLNPAVVALGSRIDGSASLVVMTTPGSGVHAGQVVARIAPTIGGRGGGRPEVAQAGGKQPEKLSDALAQVADVVAEQLRAGH
jgi:alanyl-tRNA synthetase